MLSIFFFLFFFFFFFVCVGGVCVCVWDKVSLCPFGCSENHFVDLGGLEIIEIHLSLLPEG